MVISPIVGFGVVAAAKGAARCFGEERKSSFSE